MLSIITITYNDAEGLAQTLRSVAKQRIDCEHIVIDGGSTDETLTILERHKAMRFSWISERDRGRYHAMNKGIELSNGDAIWLMHSGDCFATPESAKAGYDALKRGESRWAYGLSRVSRDGQVIEVRGAVPFRRAQFLVGRETIPHQAVIMDRSLIDQIAGYDESVGLAEDQNFLMRALAIEEPTVVPEILCDFDGSGAGSVRKPWEHYRDIWQARKRNKLSATGNRMFDAGLTLLFCTRATIAERHIEL